MKAKTTRRALLMSALSLLLCVSMLVGTTFAWFTDSVTSGRNTIQAGNLDVILECWDGDSYEEVTSTTKLFDDAALWEPGYTEVAYLKVSNAGSLALKYHLAVNVYNEILGKTKTGADIALSDSLQFKMVESDTDLAGTYAEREAAQNAPATATKLQSYCSAAKPLEKTGDAAYIALIIYMPTTVGNEANHDGVNIPKIEMGVDLLATQLVAEEDSFGPDYDKGAGWDGVVPTEMPETLVVDGATLTIHVKDAAAFAYLSTLSEKWAEFYTDGNGRDYSNYAANAGADYYYSGKWTVSLEADINLMNHRIDPVVIEIGENTGYTAFNGNNHVISNINTTTGLFADGTRANFSNLVLKNVKATNGALTGYARSSIENVTVESATIYGENYVGGLVGSAAANVTKCKVINSSVTAAGKEAGGLIGYAEAGVDGSAITENVVNNVTVYANNRAAGLIAQPNTTVKVYSNTVDTVTVVAEDVSKYQPGAVVSNALAPANVYDNTVTNCNVVVAVSTADALLNIAQRVNAGESFESKTVRLDADIDLSNVVWTPIGTGANPFNGTFDGNGKTVTLNKLSGDATTLVESGDYGYAYGLFGVIGWASDAHANEKVTIKNLNLNVSYETEDAYVMGGLVGADAAGHKGSGKNSSLACDIEISNVTVNGRVISKNEKSGVTIGGIAGKLYTKGNIAINGCTNNAVVSAETTSGKDNKVGGILGFYSGANSVAITNNTNNGAVTSKSVNAASSKAAGICVTGSTKQSVNISNNTNNGDVTGTGNAVVAIAFSGNDSPICMVPEHTTKNNSNSGKLYTFDGKTSETTEVLYTFIVYGGKSQTPADNTTDDSRYTGGVVVMEINEMA